MSQNSMPTVRRRIHFSQSIEGALANWTREDWMRFAGENGMGGWGYAKWEFQNMLRDGLKVLPMGQCEGFSYQTGCPGHPITESET